jgi:hypothetical protein
MCWDAFRREGSPGLPGNDGYPDKFSVEVSIKHINRVGSIPMAKFLLIGKISNVFFCVFIMARLLKSQQSKDMITHEGHVFNFVTYRSKTNDKVFRCEW